MRPRTLSRLFTIALATAPGVHGGCECPETTTFTRPTLPRSPDGDGGTDPPGDPSMEDCERVCGAEVVSCRHTTVAQDIAAIECTISPDCGAGRRPAGLRAAARSEGGPLIGGWLAHAAHLEAASVEAFRRLRADLAAHGAPRRLLRGCSRAAADERRHARLASSLARRRGVRPPRVELLPHTPRPLDAIAIENAVEGCVNETFGALLATWRARHAANTDIRRLSRGVARDETRHAALSWAIDAWLMARLSPDGRSRVTAARRRAVEALIVPGRFPAGLAAELQRALWR